MFWMSRFWTHETGVPHVSQNHALPATLSDTEPENDSDNEDNGILNAFTAIVNLIEWIVEDVDEEEELVESKFEKMDEQDDIHTAYAKLYKVSEKHEKLYRLTTKKLSDVELELEEISTKFDEANQTTGALRFENNFWLERPRSLRQSYSKLDFSWKGLQALSSMRCSVFRNLLPIEPFKVRFLFS